MNIAKNVTEQQRTVLSSERYGFSFHATQCDLDTLAADTETQQLFAAAIDSKVAAAIAHTTRDNSGMIENTHRVVFDLPPARHLAVAFYPTGDQEAKPVMVRDSLLRKFADQKKLLWHHEPVTPLQIDGFLNKEFTNVAHKRAGRKSEVSANYLFFN